MRERERGSQPFDKINCCIEQKRFQIYSVLIRCNAISLELQHNGLMSGLNMYKRQGQYPSRDSFEFKIWFFFAAIYFARILLLFSADKNQKSQPTLNAQMNARKIINSHWKSALYKKIPFFMFCFVRTGRSCLHFNFVALKKKNEKGHEPQSQCETCSTIPILFL